ncbi:MAG: DUF1343 domain-containing protein [Chlamydiales bacterium]|nr:DUF1343 domain-containing protein [Chlamydiales bacterium]
MGYTLPFKVVGAPWIDGQKLADKLNEQKLSGVFFHPFHYRPFYGSYRGKDCQGVMIKVVDKHTYKPLLTQYMILGILKTLYPRQFESQLSHADSTKKNLFCKANGNEEMLRILDQEPYVAWKLILYKKEERLSFSQERKKYLFYQ